MTDQTNLEAQAHYEAQFTKLNEALAEAMTSGKREVILPDIEILAGLDKPLVLKQTLINPNAPEEDVL